MPRPLRIAALQPRTFEAHDHVRAWEALLARIDESAEGHALLVLPEAAIPGWALLSREATATLGLPSEEVWSSALAERSRHTGCAIAAGIVRRDAEGALYNSLALFGPDGRRLAVASEQAASGWFAPGSGPAATEIEGVRIGLVVGRDLARRELVWRLGGVQLLIAAAAARETGRVPGGESSVESDLLAARSALLGAWAITGGKAGSEGGLVRYAGSAGVIDPAGQWAVRAPAAQPGIASIQIDLDVASGPAVDFARLPASDGTAATRDSFRGDIATVAFDPLPSAVESMERLRALVRAAAAAGSQLIVLPDFAGVEPRAVTAAETLPFLQALSAETRVTIFAGLAERADGFTFKTAYAVEDGRVLAAHRQSVLDRDERAAGFRAGDGPPPVVHTAAGAVGLLCGAEGLVLVSPAGAGLTVWCAGDAATPVAGAARAMAIEDGVTVAAAGSTALTGGAFVIGPTGRVIAATAPGDAILATARLS